MRWLLGQCDRATPGGMPGVLSRGWANLPPRALGSLQGARMRPEQVQFSPLRNLGKIVASARCLICQPNMCRSCSTK